ncbi:SDR family oxidoreductase [soil metagenome]
MKLLILGGTAWLGSQLAVQARDHGDDVVCLARGRSGTVPDGVTLVQADRDRPGAYDAVAALQWDGVIELGRQPGQVRDAARALASRCSTYSFVSSSSVYAANGSVDQDETAELLPALQSDVMDSMAVYGSAKVACEEHVRAALGEGRCLIARVGLIGGPGDGSDRSGYWPLRFARPSNAEHRVLVPDADTPVQVIDVRDLATWLLDCTSAAMAGTFNVMGESHGLRAYLSMAREVAGGESTPVPADPEWLTEQGVGYWMGPKSLPLWLPADYGGHGTRRRDKALACGLVTRPVIDTLRDSLAWELARDPTPFPRKAGLSDQEEQALLDALPLTARR